MHHNSAYWSSLAETTLTFPPQLVFLCDEDRKIQRNCLNTLVNITTRIRETNRSDKHFADHLLVSRKGSKPKHKLHLIDELKLKMGKAVVEYFKWFVGWERIVIYGARMKLLLIDQPNLARCNIFILLTNIFPANIHQGSLDKLYIHSQASFLIKCLKDEKSSISFHSILLFLIDEKSLSTLDEKSYFPNFFHFKRFCRILFQNC